MMRKSQDRIFVLRSDRLGDIVLSSGYLASLAEQFPDHEIELWLSPEMTACSEILHPKLTVRALPFDRYLRSGPEPLRDWLHQIDETGYAFGVVPQFTLGYPEVLTLGWSNVSPMWGFQNFELGVNPEWVERELGPPQKSRHVWIGRGPEVGTYSHEVEKYGKLAESQDLRAGSFEPRLSGVQAQTSKSGILIWPGSGDALRRWPAARFAAVAGELGWTNVTVGGTIADRGAVEDLWSEMRDRGIAVDIAFREINELRNTAAWLTGFELLLTNDTGIAHLGSAAGADVVSVSGSQHQGRFFAYGLNTATVFSDVACRRCGGSCLFDASPYPCVEDVADQDVARVIRERGIGPQPLTPNADLVFPDGLAGRLHSSRRAQVEALEIVRLESDAVFRGLRRSLRESEDSAQRREEETQAAITEVEKWKALCESAEKQRDEAVRTLHAAELERAKWMDLCCDAERQRDERQQLLSASERDRANWLQQCKEAERQRDEWKVLCGEAERQKDAWQSDCREAERQRTELEAQRRELESELARTREVQAAAQLESDHWKRQSEAAGSRLEHIAAMFPWAIQAAEAPEGMPRISIITPSFQKGEYIEETIQSVLAENDPNFEHIVVDGASTDGTEEILKRYPHLRSVSEPDGGQAHAINKGLLLSTGEIVAYLNADDVYRPGVFAEIRKFFHENPTAQILVGNCDYIDAQSRVTGHLKARYQRPYDLIRYWGWDRWYCIPQQSVFWRKSLLADVGLFDPSLHMVMDYEMWLRIAHKTQIYILDKTLAAFRLMPETKTGSSTHIMYLEEFQVSRKYWMNLPFQRRLQTAFAANRHVATKLLDVAEHFELNGIQPGAVRGLLFRSLRYWPGFVISPRAIFTGLETVARSTLVLAALKKCHRGYLGVKWRLLIWRRQRVGK